MPPPPFTSCQLVDVANPAPPPPPPVYLPAGISRQPAAIFGPPLRKPLFQIESTRRRRVPFLVLAAGSSLINGTGASARLRRLIIESAAAGFDRLLFLHLLLLHPQHTTHTFHMLPSLLRQDGPSGLKPQVTNNTPCCVIRFK